MLATYKISAWGKRASSADTTAKSSDEFQHVKSSGLYSRRAQDNTSNGEVALGKRKWRSKKKRLEEKNGAIAATGTSYVLAFWAMLKDLMIYMSDTLSEIAHE